MLYIRIIVIYKNTIVDAHGHAILTMMERSTNFRIMQKLPRGKSRGRLLFPYKKTLRTITMDNGCEFAAHLQIKRGLSMRGRKS